MSVNTATSNVKKLWLYFKKCYGPNGEFINKAECLNCSKKFVYKSTDNDGSLWRHTKHFHGIEREYCNKNTAQPVAKSISQPVKKKVKNTDAPVTPEEIFVKPVETVETKNVPIYRYFTQYSNGKVKCRVCMSAGLPTESLSNQASYMLSHLKKHPRAYKLYELEEEFGQKGPEFDEHVHLPDTTSALSIFNRTSDGKYHCEICQTRMSGSMEMQKHLKEKHPTLSEQDVGNDVIYTEVVFVGEKNKKKTFNKQVYSNNPAKDTKVTKKELHQHFDAFGHYVTSLLNSMPKDDSIKMQQKILNTLIEAKLNSQSSKNQDANITHEESEEAVIADDIDLNDNDSIDLSDTGNGTEEVVLVEEHLESIDEEHVEDIEDVLEEEEPVLKRFKYANKDILELS